MTKKNTKQSMIHSVEVQVFASQVECKLHPPARSSCTAFSTKCKAFYKMQTGEFKTTLNGNDHSCLQNPKSANRHILPLHKMTNLNLFQELFIPVVNPSHSVVKTCRRIHYYFLHVCQMARVSVHCITPMHDKRFSPQVK